MNFISFSPHFPPNFVNFWVQLRRKGVNVLGLGDAAFEELPVELRTHLSEYYRVTNQHNYDELLRAAGYFTHRYGKIDRIESHNEYWLETDARLRTDFNVTGFKVGDMPPIKRKSEMKKVFIQAGLNVAAGRVCKTIEEARALVEEIGLPLVTKPDIGVGASNTYAIRSQAELETFFANKTLADYIFEEYVPGSIQTYDGLVDQDGKVIFQSSLEYSEGVMDLVNQGCDFYYYTHRQISPALTAAGRRLVELYGLRERFFHFEFFQQAEDEYVALEVNMRPPGGLTTDMWNYANDFDIYRGYADIVVDNHFETPAVAPYHCAYFSRRIGRSYLHTHAEILAAFSSQIVSHSPISGVFAAALGDYGYLARSPQLDELAEMAGWIMEQS
jgi:hypothetical protein